MRIPVCRIGVRGSHATLALLLGLAVLSVRATAQAPLWSPISAVGGGLFGPGGAPPMAAAVDDAGRLVAALPERQAGFNGARLARWDGSGWTVLSGWVNTSPPFGRLNALCVSPSGDAIYVAGRFSAGSDGPNGPVVLSNLGRFDLAADAWDLGFAGPDDLVHDCGVDAAGRLSLAGNFTSAGGVALANGVGRWDPATGTWAPLGTPSGFATTVAVEPGGGVVLGLNPVERYDDATGVWTPLGTAFDAGAILRQVETDGTDVVVAGQLARGGTAGTVFEWDGTAWQSVSGLPGTTSPRSIALDGAGTLYVVPEAGASEVYARAPGMAAPAVVADNPTEIFRFVSTNARRAGPEAFLGGVFSTVGVAGGAPVAAYNYGRWDGAVWSALSAQGSGTLGVVYAVESIEPRHPWPRPYLRAIAVGGDITQVNYRAVNKVALFNGTIWGPMGQGVTDPAGTVRAIASQPTVQGGYYGDYRIYVGGQFTEVSNAGGAPIPVSNVAVWNMTAQTWASLGQGVSVGGVAGTGIVHAVEAVYSLELIPTTPDYLYVGGAFDTATNGDGTTVAVNNLARFNLATQAWEAVAGGVDGPVLALEATPVFSREIPSQTLGHGLVVGGDFPQALGAGGAPVPDTPHIVRLTSRDDWEPVGRGTNGPVRALAFRGTTDCGGDLGCSVLRAVSELESVLYVGGDFTAVTDGPSPYPPAPSPLKPAAHLAKWMPLVNQWDVFGHAPLENGVNGPVRTLQVDRTRSYWNTRGALALVVGGDFTEAWSERAQVPATRLALLVDKRPVYDFTLPPESSQAEWATETVEDYGGGLDLTVRAVAAASCLQAGSSPSLPQFFMTNSVYPGGDFASAGTSPVVASPFLARWRARIVRGGLTVLGTTSGCPGGCTTRVGPTATCFSSALGLQAPTEALATVDFGETVQVDADTLETQTPLVEVSVTDGDGTTYPLPDVLLGPLDAPTLLVLAGVTDPSLYAPNPDGADTALGIVGTPVQPGLAGEPFVQVVHAVTDAPAVDVVLADGTVLADSLGFRTQSRGTLVAIGDHTAEVSRHDDGAVLGSFSVTVPEDAGSLALVLSGFLDPSANQDGPALTLLPVVLVEAPPVEREHRSGPDGLSVRIAPNPVTGEAAVRFEAPTSGHATVEVIDALGRRVAVLHDGPSVAGPHTLRWVPDGLASGVYLLRLRTAAASVTRPVTVLR